MYRTTQYESKSSLNFKIPWDSNTARGFGITMAMTLICVLLAPVLHIDPPPARTIEFNTVPLEVMNFGDGDGTGVSKGNLAEEGALHKGRQPQSNLNDAEVAAKTRQNNRRPTNPDDRGNFVARNELSSDESNSQARGSDSRNVGDAEGSESGTGLGEKGSGDGKGMGFGDIEWGGGGNRTVLYKKLPEFPDGVNMSAQIRIRFKVLADGTVSSMMPLQKGDPALEHAAMEALRQWRFNPLEEDKEMVGIITFTFRLS
jgi:TonB family protein